MGDLIRYATRLHRLPVAVRWAASALLAVLSFVAWYAVFGLSADLPFVLFLPAVILSAALFDRGSGFVATAAGTVIVVYFFAVVRAVTPIKATHLVALVISCAVGAFIAAITEAFHRAYLDSERARAETEAGRVRAEEARQDSVVLLREFRHRVSNDLQRIVAMLRLQAARNPEAKPALEDAAARVQSMAKIHQRLAHQAGHALVDARAFLHELVADFRQGLAELRPIGWFVEAEQHVLSGVRVGGVVHHPFERGFQQRPRFAG